MRRLAPVLVLLAVLAGANLALPPWHQEQFAPPVEGRTRADILLDLLGELRTFMARSLFMRADLYHHVMESQGISWRQEQDILPLFRMIALLDPHLVEAYDTAAYDLVLNFGRPREGLEFLREGLRQNPDSAQLHGTLAFLLFQTGDYEGTIPAAGRTLQLSADEFLSLNAIRLMAHAQRKLGRREDEVHALRMWLTMRPDDPYARPRLVELGQEPRGFSQEELLRMQPGR